MDNRSLIQLIETWLAAAEYYRVKGREHSVAGDSLMATDYHSSANAYCTAAFELAGRLGVNYDAMRRERMASA